MSAPRIESINTKDSGGAGRIPLAAELKEYARRLGGEPVRADAKKFVIFGQGRSGSTLLVDLLNCIPDTHCDREILGRKVVFPLRWVNAQRKAQPSQHYGFKVKIYQLTDTQQIDPRRFLSELHEQGWQGIYLWRRDVVRQILSNFTLARDRQSQYVGADRPKTQAVWVNPQTVLYGIEGRAALWEQERAALAGVDFHEVVYEDDLLSPESHQATLGALTSYLGLPHAQAKTDRHKINVGPLRELIQNYDEIAEVLQPTRWAEYLD